MGAMSCYIRPKITGALVFFTVCLAHRDSDLLVREIETLRQAVREVKADRPFEIMAWGERRLGNGPVDRFSRERAEPRRSAGSHALRVADAEWGPRVWSSVGRDQVEVQSRGLAEIRLAEELCLYRCAWRDLHL